jgi:diamine N-acetyltransferase
MSAPLKKPVFLRGKKVELRPVEASDLDTFQVWVNDPEIRRDILIFRPVTQMREKEWNETIQKDPNAIHFAIWTLDGMLIGNTGIFDIHWPHRFGQTGTLIGEERFRNQGFGFDAKMQLLNYAFNTLDLRRISSGAFEFNERSLRYNLKCGYQIEGRARKQYFKDGQYWDLIHLGVLREEWQPLWEEYCRG